MAPPVPAPAPAPPRAVAQALRIAAREAAALVRTPVAYVVAVAFLAVQGWAFAGVVAALSDPRRPAPLGAVLEGTFGGSLLHWAVLLAVVSLLAMRTVAEHRRAGTWEVQLTAPVGEGAAVVGAWLGALAFYLLLWVPTLAYLAVIAAYAPAGAALDLGPVAAAYLGEAVIGASLLAVGVAASAATSNQIVAGVATFAIGLLVLLAGEARDLAPELGGGVAAVSRAISVREHLATFARGELALAPIVIHAGLAATALSAAATLARAGRRRGAEVAARGVATALVGTIAVLAAALAARHPRALDVTAARVHRLDPATLGVLARVDAPVELAILRPAAAPLEPVYAVVERTAARIAARQPLVRVRAVDPALAPAEAAALARELGVPAEVVERGGAVVVARGARREIVFLADLAEYGRDALDAPAVTRLSARAALAGAIAQVTDDAPATACVTAGHGELPLEPRDDGLDAALAVERLRRAGVRVEPLDDLIAGVPARCTVVAVLGPRVPLAPAEAAAIDAHVAGGGGLLVAAASRDPGEGTLPPTGLEPALRALGLEVPSAVVIDPERALALPAAFAVVDGYGDHPAVRGFAGWRTTVWQWARPVQVRRAADVEVTPLVTTSRRAWATRDLAAAPAATTPTDPDLLGPHALVVHARRAGAGPVVVAGSAEAMASAAPRAGVGAGDVLLAALVAHLAGRDRPELAIPDDTPAQVRLVMTRGERRAVAALSIVVLPLAFAAIGIALAVWRRRRRS